MAIQIAPMVAAQGFVEVPIWLAMCGIYPAGREKTFRGNPKLTPWDRVQEAMDAGRWPASKSVELKKAGRG
ncbi:hypothetical protein SSE37_22844 [Sagittula stellata E-37]|uniref:Uncharacterized protein n=1 Tax=Sagittula stellata (strain ATCC 700073 / DSM 11524 / E-37) TaxID=388399 RepID=A3K014_SAGS3|nr:hypothetical protein SSE37_22844 [Sagittula stellata E-37]